VDLSEKSVAFYVPTPESGIGDAPPAPAAPMGLVQGNSFVMTVHVDNNACAAKMYEPTLNGNPAGDECGILSYPKTPSGQPLGSISLQYAAGHRNGYATYSFYVSRGAFPLPRPGVTLTGIPASGQVNSGVAGLHTAVNPTLNMLAREDNDGFCPVAGFVAQIKVDVWTTDGLGVLEGYDAFSQFAFAVAPEGL
jgi:hypothetical protein